MINLDKCEQFSIQNSLVNLSENLNPHVTTHYAGTAI